MRKHPNHEAVLAVIEPLLEKRFFRDWSMDGLRHDFLGSSYELLFSNGNLTVTVRILSEWVDAALDSTDRFAHLRIKRLLKNAFKIVDADDD